MKSVFLVGCGLREQLRIKSFLQSSYAVRVNPSVNNSLATLERDPFDLIIYDADNAVPLSFFLDQINLPQKDTPISVLSSTKQMEEIQKMHDLGVASIIKKPCTKRGLLKGVHEAMTKHPAAAPAQEQGAPGEAVPAAPAGRSYAIRKSETDVIIGLRKHAVISKIGEQQVSFLLPASLRPGARFMFRSAEFLELLGFRTTSPPTFEIEVKNCAKIEDFQFEVDAGFVDERWEKIKGPLQAYVQRNAVSRKVPSASRTVLLADENATTREFFRACLVEGGFNVVEASDGFGALEKLEGGAADLLVVDLLLPKLSGQEIIEVLKNRNNVVPIVVATGETNPNVVREVRPRVQAFLPKPVKGKDLVDSVGAAFDGWQQGADAPPGGGDGGAVEVRLSTNLMVAFRDRVRLINIGPGGLTFARNGPIAPGTLIFTRTDAIASVPQGPGGPVTSLEMRVSQCRPEGRPPGCLVDAEILSGSGPAF